MSIDSQENTELDRMDYPSVSGREILDNIELRKNRYFVEDTDLPLTYSNGKPSDEALYVASEHNEDIEISLGKKLQLENTEQMSPYIGEDGFKGELNDLAISAAVMVVQGGDIFDPKDELSVREEDKTPRWFERVGRQILDYIREEEEYRNYSGENYMSSQEISNNLEFSSKEVAQAMHRIQKHSNVEIDDREMGRQKRWNLTKAREEIDIDKVLEEGWEAL